MQTPQAPPATSDISDIVIDDVNKSLWAYIKIHYKVKLIFAALGGLIYYATAIYLFSKFDSSSSDGRGEGYVLALPLVIFSAWYYGLQNKFEAEFLSQFAQANGFTFSKTGQVDELYGTIFRMKGRQDISDIITGSYKGLPLRIFLFELTVGSGRSQQTWQDTVFEIDFSVQLPSLMVSKKSHNLTGNGLDVAGNFNGSKLQLEGDFSNNFDLLVPNGLQIEALQIFTPDVMEILQNLKDDFRSVELSGNKIYIYVNGYISKSSVLESAFQLAKTLINKLSLVANDFKVDPSISAQPAHIESTKKSKFNLENVMFAIFVLALIFMCVALFLARMWQY
jgi:hypothetical protein